MLHHYLAPRGRAILLEQLLQHLTEQNGVWFARCREIAAWWRSADTHEELPSEHG
jgi:peptidoglycan-N-acetylglucosamine deacetylase